MAITPSFTTEFDLDAQSATAGKFVFTDTFDYAGAGIALADVTGAFTLIYPDLTGRTGDISTPDITGNVSLVFDTLNVPKDSNGDYMEGAYSFAYTVLVAGAVQPGTTTTTVSFTFVNQIPTTASLSLVLDCLCARLTVTDRTDYGTFTTQNLSYTVFAPATTPAIVNETFAALTFIYSLDGKVTGVYYVIPNVTLTYVLGTVTVSGRLNDGQSQEHRIDVQCDIDLCGLQVCLNAYNNWLTVQLAQYGTFNELPADIKNDFEEILLNFQLFESAAKCGAGEQATTAYNKLLILLECDCGSSTSVTTRTITASCNTSGGTTVLQNTDNNIDVTSNVIGSTTTWTIDLSATAVALLASVAVLAAQVAALEEGKYFQINNTLSDSGTTNAAGGTLETLKTFTVLFASYPLADGETVKFTARFTIAANARDHSVGYQLFQGVVKDGITILFPKNVGVAQTVEVHVEIERISAASARITQRFISSFSGSSAQTLFYTSEIEAVDFTANFDLRATGQNNTAPFTNDDVVCHQLKAIKITNA